MQSKSAGLNWLLLLLLILLLLLLLICIILLCCIRCNRGGVYPVYEKEKLRGHDYLKEEDDAGFGEYTRADEPAMLKGIKGSLDSVEKPLEESETDSLGEYEDPDPSKFNEDGSFIGQYGGKKKGGGGDEVATPTNALSSFV
ncbi:hypothetical protein HELRODRAFT_177613 [Helobdella robusta]|uniref:Neurofascin/L1/NrCAM C-terminal domain-containing protein n=1 Tax=Helobdella robusta TaxID=6412 RepID=T1FBY2_HELRO|nr:hypothetical protein HELRODRAFT_177613 [Helobdella robusta]ESN97948.1 hypothetical protein HELRODRAFT_177613 [Helobdella robusta]